jgi:hypothetical protein
MRSAAVVSRPVFDGGVGWLFSTYVSKADCQ